MSKESLEIISEIYKALARRDLPAILSLIDSKIVVSQTELLPWGGEYLGFEGIQQFFTRLFGTIDSQLAVEEFVDVGDKVIVIGFSRGEVRATGTRFNLRAVHIWTVSGSRAVRFESHIDTPKMLEVLGRSHELD
jgi:ketosteroid isomerase-like protein